MKNYPEADLVQIAHCLQCCDYSKINLIKMKPDLDRIKKEERAANNPEHNPFFIKRIFLIQGFIISFGQVLSYFHEVNDRELFGKMNSTPEQREHFYKKIRGVSAHVGDFSEYIEGIMSLLSGTCGINWFSEQDIVNQYVVSLMESKDAESANKIKAGWAIMTKKESDGF